MNKESKKALQKILDYLWDDERRHFMECFDDNPKSASEHIFRKVVVLDNWLNKRNWTPEMYEAIRV